MKYFFGMLCFSSVILSCYPEKPAGPGRSFIAPVSMPSSLVRIIEADRTEFFLELDLVFSQDTEGLLILTDKAHPLPATYIPSDLVALENGRSYELNKTGLFLRSASEASLEKMAASARKEGITLAVSSAYRSFAYQRTVYERNVRELGQSEADRESAKPGTSQHQLGTTVDFGSITDAFAGTGAGIWLADHAGEFGWSLSFPDGYESVTGYRWESWHYRYIGIASCRFQKKWFGGIQQFMLEAISGL